jgi:hypothetical protein
MSASHEPAGSGHTAVPAELLQAGLETATATLADLVRQTDQGLRIPACLTGRRQLATMSAGAPMGGRDRRHQIGKVHRVPLGAGRAIPGGR